MPAKGRIFLKLTGQFERALNFALAAHAGQNRKGTEVPYASHLLAVASIVLDYGGDEEEAIAGLLHDCVEDRGVDPAELRTSFGARVAEMVVACSDSLAKDPTMKAPWRERKEKYLEHMKTAAPSVLLVSAADKLHNVRSISKDLREIGAAVWDRFKVGSEESLWFYETLVAIFQARGYCRPLVDELARAVTELRALTSSCACSLEDGK
jgi:(p)ppGpp synthase/HD superfamily hydrolase